MKKLIALALIASLTSCKDYLEEIPEDTLVTTSFYKTESDALSAVSAVYSRLNKGMYNRNFYLYTDILTDDCTAGVGVNNAFIRALDNFVHAPVNDRLETGWQEHYDGINRANAAIKYVPGITMNTDLRDRLVGEAKFLRGLLYFNLVRLFGPVPLVLEPTTTAEGLDVEQATVEAIYGQIVQDLTDAEAVLPPTYGSRDLGRATNWAATSLLAKVYLTRKEWSLAAQKAKEVIDSKAYDLWEDYANIFKVATENQREAIFSAEFMSNTQNGNGMMQSAMPRNKVPGLNGFESDIPTEDLVKAYAVGDRRKEVTIQNSLEVGGTVYTFINSFFKYYDPATFARSNDSGVNYPILRYADVLLMYAEALNELGGPSAEAYAAINRIRQRARMNQPDVLPDLEGLTQEQFREAIFKERRLEFAFEGQRWFDLVRSGQMVKVMQAQGKTSAQEFHNLLPIPQRELDANPKLEQNPGYK